MDTQTLSDIVGTFWDNRTTLEVALSGMLAAGGVIGTYLTYTAAALRLRSAGPKAVEKLRQEFTDSTMSDVDHLSPDQFLGKVGTYFTTQYYDRVKGEANERDARTRASEFAEEVRALTDKLDPYVHAEKQASEVEEILNVHEQHLKGEYQFFDHLARLTEYLLTHKIGEITGKRYSHLTVGREQMLQQKIQNLLESTCKRLEKELEFKEKSESSDTDYLHHLTAALHYSKAIDPEGGLVPQPKDGGRYLPTDFIQKAAQDYVDKRTEQLLGLPRAASKTMARTKLNCAVDLVAANKDQIITQLFTLKQLYIGIEKVLGPEIKTSHYLAEIGRLEANVGFPQKA